MLAILEERYQAPFDDEWQTSDFRCRALGNNYYLLTYVLLEMGNRKSRRTTLYHHTGSDWKIVYHQGTLF